MLGEDCLLSMKNVHSFRNLLYAVSNKSGGNMDFKWGSEREVLSNRKLFLKNNEINLDDIVAMEVEHEERILIADSSMKGKVIFTEALITKEKNLPLFLTTADCLPIAFWDAQSEVIALAHCGWRPTNRKLVSKVIARMEAEFNSNPKDLFVSIGPGIHKESYIFKNPIQKTIPDWFEFLEDTPEGDTHIDLVGYNKAQLLEAGIPENQIEIDSNDTFLSEDYFSHFRSVRTEEQESRFATVLMLR